MGRVAMALLLAASAASARDYDFCSTVVVRPDQNWRSPATCTHWFTEDEIARGAEAVWIGDFTDVSHPVIPAPGRTCLPNPSHATMRPYVDALKAARAAAGGPPMWIVHMHRFDLLPTTFAALPAFLASYLLRTTKPWADVLGFWTGSPVRWSDSWGGATTTSGRLRDYIDASGGAGSYQSAVYYLARPDASNVAWPTNVMADLGNPAYRAWRVAEAKEALAVGGYNLVDLNQKLPHYLFGPHAIGTSGFPTVAAVQASGDTAWSAMPAGYAYTQYVAGLVALAADLRAALVPYSFMIALRAWGGDSFDDKTTTVNEAAMLREIMRGARVVFFDQPMDARPQSMIDQAIAGLAPTQVILIDQGCGISINPLGAPRPPALLN